MNDFNPVDKKEVPEGIVQTKKQILNEKREAIEWAKTMDENQLIIIERDIAELKERKHNILNSRKNSVKRRKEEIKKIREGKIVWGWKPYTNSKGENIRSWTFEVR